MMDLLHSNNERSDHDDEDDDDNYDDVIYPHPHRGGLM